MYHYYVTKRCIVAHAALHVFPFRNYLTSQIMGVTVRARQIHILGGGGGFTYI
jgi:hypothetical protein